MSTDIFVGTSGPRNARIAIVGESWGSEEQRQGRPFVGRSGDELRRLLAESGIAYNECFLTNVVNRQPPGNKMELFFYPTSEATAQSTRGLYPNVQVGEGLHNLRQQLLSVSPEIVIGFGNYALWALTEDSFGIGYEKGRKVPTGITSWRRSQLYCRDDMGGFPFLPTYHPAAALRQYPWRYAIKHDLSCRVPLVKHKWEAPSRHLIVRPSYKTAMNYLRFIQMQGKASVHLKRKQRIAVDIETRGGHIACIGFAWNSTEAICIPFMTINPDDHNYFTHQEECNLHNVIREILVDPNIEITGQNFLYDAQYINDTMFVVPKCHLDTMIIHHVCWPGTPKGLDYLSSLYCEHHVYWKDEGKEWNTSIPEESYWAYNCKDAIATWEISYALEDIVKQLNLEVPASIQMRQWSMILNMMLRGIRIDQKSRAGASIALMETMMQYEQAFEDIVPLDWTRKSKTAKPWYRSPKQQATLFYDVLGIKEVKSRKTGNRTCDDDALRVIALREPIVKNLCAMMQEYRSAGVFYSTFTQAPLDHDKRMRCSFNPSGTDTFRWNSSKNAYGRGANLQNIPKGTEDD